MNGKRFRRDGNLPLFGDTFSWHNPFTFCLPDAVHPNLKHLAQTLSALLILLVFGVAIWVAKEQLGGRLEDQVLARQAEVLQAISLVHQVNVIEVYGDLSMENPADQLIVMEEISELSGALGFRLFTAEADYLYSFPEIITEGVLSEIQVQQVNQFSPSATLSPNAKLIDWFELADGGEGGEIISVTEIVLPLHVADGDDLLGIVQLIFDGEDTLADINDLKNQINSQSIFVFIVGSGLIVLVLGISFNSLNRSHNRLAKRTVALNEANQALALSSKTAAIGGIASHLMHGLRNPLIALKTYLANTKEKSFNLDDARNTVSRMEELVDDVVRTLRDHQSGIAYRITVRELLELFKDKFLPTANRYSVDLQVEVDVDSELDNREASLILLIIENLAHNAAEACRSKGEILVHAKMGGVIEISDNGIGLPDSVKEDLFQAGRSSKEQGSGLGLAISKQLAMAIDAELSLAKSDENGTTFELRLAKRDA